MSNNRTSGELYEEYSKRMNMIADLRYSAAVLQWDQETYLPPKGAKYRGQQLATLSELSHEYFTRSEFGELLKRLSDYNDLDPAQQRNVQLTLEDYTRQKKLPTEFVRELTEAINKSFHSWIQARKQNSFAVFADDLSRLVELKRREASILGFADHPYDALLDEYDKGSNVRALDEVFGNMKKPLYELLEKIRNCEQVNDEFLYQNYPKDKQWEFGMRVLKDLHYDFEAGRQDVSEHPFSTSFNSNDVRITTRIDENDLGNMTWSCIHELGHALYEQGLPEDQYGLPAGEAASLTVHESQSRLWENHIGRSLAFSNLYLPVLQEYFPGKLDTISPTDFYRGINKVRPSLIRTEADELTYHFHVMIRYELEKQLIAGEVQPADIPSFWNEQYKELLGVIVPDDRQGCLQDVHWSHGSFGYFPTYSLGSFLSAQIYRSAAKEISGLNELENGASFRLLQWLRGKIHIHGRKMETAELSRHATGESLNVQHFLDYINEKYKGIYQF